MRKRKPRGPTRLRSGYCCEYCDGPYEKYMKSRAKRLKKKIRQCVKKDIQEQLEQDKAKRGV